MTVHRQIMQQYFYFDSLRTKNANFKLKVIAMTNNRSPVVSASAVFTEILYWFAIAT